MYQKKAPVTVLLAVINGVVFLALSFLGMTENAGFMLEHGAMYFPDVVYGGKYAELVTSMFLHFGIEHLLNNMLILVLFGQQLEQILGSVKYLLLYMASGIGANIVSLAWDWITGDYAVSAGASGAIFGIVAALLYIAICRRGQAGGISGTRLVLMIALTLYMGFVNSGVNNAAHLGGLVLGFLMAACLYRGSATGRGR